MYLYVCVYVHICLQCVCICVSLCAFVGAEGANLLCACFCQITMLQIISMFSRGDQVLIPFNNGIGDFNVHTTVNVESAKNRKNHKTIFKNDFVFYRVSIHC